MVIILADSSVGFHIPRQLIEINGEPLVARTIRLLKENGKPHWGYFVADGLHMSKAGYVIWGGAVKQAIKDWLG